MENVTKTMLLTSSIKIDTKEVISKIENNALESMDIKSKQEPWRKTKKRWRNWMWYVLTVYGVIIIFGMIWLWRHAKFTILEWDDMIGVGVGILAISILLGVVISGLFEKSPSDYTWYKDINSKLKETVRLSCLDIQAEIYGGVLISIFPKSDSVVTKILTYQRRSHKEEITDNGYLSDFINNDIPSWFTSFFTYNWEWEFIQEFPLVRLPDQQSIYIQKIFLNTDNMVCILLEGDGLTSEFAGFDTKKISSKEYIKVWKG